MSGGGGLGGGGGLEKHLRRRVVSHASLSRQRITQGSRMRGAHAGAGAGNRDTQRSGVRACGDKCGTAALLLHVLLHHVLLQHAEGVPVKHSRHLEPRVALRGDMEMHRSRVPSAGLRRVLQDKGPCTKLVSEIQEREAAGERMGKLSDVRCDERGYFLPVQTWRSTGYVWCVDVNTNEELEGTMTEEGPASQSLDPAACLALAHPPPGTIPLHGACQTSQAACTGKCWWEHCRLQRAGYCPTCKDGLACSADTTTPKGFALGTCQSAGPDCVDDPDNRLAAVGYNCGSIKSGGYCGQNFGFMFPLHFPDESPKYMARNICPIACNSCPDSTGPTADDSDDIDPKASAQVQLESWREQMTQVRNNGRDLSKQFCFGCWSDTTYTCRQVEPNHVEDGMMEACEASGNTWQDPNRLLSPP